MKIHIVRPGEQLWDLVQKYNVPLERVLEANPNIMEPEQLEVGSKVRIPSGRVPVSPVKRDYLKEKTGRESFKPQKPIDPQWPLTEQPVGSPQDLQLTIAKPIRVEDAQFYDQYQNEPARYDEYDDYDESSEVPLDEWESSSIYSYQPSHPTQFAPFYPTEPGFYSYPHLSHASTPYPNYPCTDCGSTPSYPPQAAMSTPPYPFWTPYGNHQPAYWQPEMMMNQVPEYGNEAFESSSAEF
ncbi:LysM domain-containing protein [Thermoactinomyces sp. DSM 45891]|uniref:LysM peptidoglycan-binding domain-containing protein n=1 Tax=Thermoactinomyces sp. DSM 45891 TaxID=1761907 RepID=UPI0009152873|nr:LysM domain-containing protein [Thermoactinomyces sp. DSM 45891]SFX09063.1 LysM domain-containing protein [Thermoactinomyces sp. DSM 45891]